MATGDVLKPPANLSFRVGLPVLARAGHLPGRKSLRNSVGPSTTVFCIPAPGGLALPQLGQTGELALVPLVGEGGPFAGIGDAVGLGTERASGQSCA